MVDMVPGRWEDEILPIRRDGRAVLTRVNETGLSHHADIGMSLRGHRGRWAGTTPALFRIASESPHLMLPV
jgi:hypothetical protein